MSKRDPGFPVIFDDGLIPDDPHAESQQRPVVSEVHFRTRTVWVSRRAWALSRLLIVLIPVIVILNVKFGVEQLFYRFRPGSREGVVTSTANLRSGPGLGYHITATLSAGESVRVIEEKGDWLKVKVYPYDPAYMSRALVEIEE